MRETAGETEELPASGSWVSSEVSSILKCVCVSVYLQSFSSVHRGVKPHWRTVSLSLALRVETHQSSDPHIHTQTFQGGNMQTSSWMKLKRQSACGSLTNNLFIFFLSFRLKSQWFIASEENVQGRLWYNKVRSRSEATDESICSPRRFACLFFFFLRLKHYSQDINAKQSVGSSCWLLPVPLREKQGVQTTRVTFSLCKVIRKWMVFAWKWQKTREGIHSA